MPVDESLALENGEVLDVLRRPLTAMKQVAQLLQHPDYKRSDPALVWCSDFYTTGFDALAYSRLPFKAYSFLWAQSFDRFDFTASEHLSWMPYWEAMALSLYSKVFVASEALRELIWARSPSFADKVSVVGLPFDPESCRQLLLSSELPQKAGDYLYDVVWSSRLDVEKCPGFFIDLARKCPDLRFAIFSGRPPNVGTAAYLFASGTLPANLTYHANLSKAAYYSLLSRSRVQFNAALQDWVSFTLLEALTFGCAPVYPCFRSFVEEPFPEICYYRHGDLNSAVDAIRRVLAEHFVVAQAAARPILAKHSQTLSRITEEIYDDAR